METEKKPEVFYTIRDLTKRWKRDRITVMKHTKALPQMRLGGRILFPVEVIHEFESSMMVNTKGET